jgi:hypothetical protein
MFASWYLAEFHAALFEALHSDFAAKRGQNERPGSEFFYDAWYIW